MTSSSSDNGVHTQQVVVDANLVFQALAPNEQRVAARQRIDEWRNVGIRLAAPTLWRYELTSIVCKTLHFGQLSRAQSTAMIELIDTFEIELVIPDNSLARRAFEWTLQLKRVAAYDSFYLALAQHLQCELWTADKRLFNAANVDWVRYLGEPG